MKIFCISVIIAMALAANVAVITLSTGLALIAQIPFAIVAVKAAIELEERK